MPRPPRLQIPGGAYHVTARGVARLPLFRDNDDRRRFLNLLAEVIARRDWTCHAYCLMGTHYHLLVRTPEADLARGMQRLNSCYAQGFNRRHRETGHRLERRYNSVLVETDSHALELLRYFALNPVRAGVCASAEDWRWSSYPAVIGRMAAPPFLAVEWALAYFGGNRDRARMRFARFVSDMAAAERFVKGLTPGRATASGERRRGPRFRARRAS